MFCDCEAVQEHRPPQGDEPLLSWVTGIFFEPPEFRQDLPSTRDTWKLPLIEERWRPHSAVFVDGSVFNQRWVPIRAGASAVTVPGLFKHSVAVQGASVNSFRCELFALILALHLTAGDVVIATDCASVLRRAKFLQSQNFLWDCTFQFENPDLWEMFLDVARKHDGNIQFVKVKAHTNGHTGQCPVLTAGNEEVDALAKATAKALSSKLVVEFQPYLERAVAVQAHLIATLVSRTNACQLAPFDEDDKPPAGLIQTFVCTCKPRRRLVTKSPRICYKSCHLHGHTVLVGDVESRILQSYKSHMCCHQTLFLSSCVEDT